MACAIGALIASIGLESCSCAVGRPTAERDGAPEDTGVDSGQDAQADVPFVASCGDGVLDTEAFEVCDPGLPVGTSELLRCNCPSDGVACTDDQWVDDPTQGKCYGTCQHIVLTGFGYNTCDDGIACTQDALSPLGGTFANCDPLCVNLPKSTTDTTCDGLDDNCNGFVDEGYAPRGTTCGAGACAAIGVTSCFGGVEQNSCMAGNSSLVDNTCNNTDDDCNGVKDDGYVPLATTCGVGACERTGFNSCAGGAVINSCVPGFAAGSDTTCNGIDDDCNGIKDDGYVPLTISCGVGACAATGTTACVLGVVVNMCTPGVAAATDTTCNGVDDNCDGAKDEGYVTTTTSCGVGACAASGFAACVNGTVSNNCTAGTAAGSDTTCNNIDDDCNGLKDDGYVATATSCGVGACARTGTNQCVAGALVNNCTAGAAAANDASCNNIDDDCNGAKDDGYVPAATTCGVGACTASGTTSCMAGVTLNSCIPGAAAGSDTTCNNIDDDCNGIKDEGYLPLATSCGIGACAATGATVCTAGVISNSCMAGTAAATDTTCNAIDDNCNGSIDEGWVVTPTMCGSGVCSNSGGMVCVNGVVSNSCVAGMAGGNDTTCNAQDDDCSGQNDEDYVSVPTACGVGACAAVGVSSCSAGVTLSSCNPGTPAANDATCNNTDDNCNGSKDEDYVQMTTSCGVGACARTGLTSCSGGVVSNSCMPGSAAGSDTTCNGIDDDCNGLIDDGYVVLATSCGVGGCGRTGVTSCVSGAVLNSCSPGTPAATDTSCNGIDDNCNGVKDEGYVTVSTSCGIGACRNTGFTTCSSGLVVDSCAAYPPAGSDSTCNNVDDDCNGVKDDGYISLATTCGTGACARTGATSCSAGVVSNSCSAGTAAPSDSNCNNIDDDCNGVKDDGYVVLATACGTGACARTGFNTCVTGTVVNSCVSGSPAGSDTTCNNVDDDCNGAKDDGYLPVTTSCGTGACAASGITACVSGSVTNSCSPGAPSATDTTCNNIDDNCNGTKDEGYVSMATSCGLGACAATGANTCVSGAVVNSCTSLPPAGSDTTCNGIDDNCNGTKDEGYVSVATMCGMGACAASGTTSCVSGTTVNSCVAGTPAATDTTCNNIDENCNGVKDEGYVSLSTSCGVGACLRSGVTSCATGVVSNSCVAGTAGPSDTSCDGVDNNCNGTTDEGYLATTTTCGVGGCMNSGLLACISGTPTNTCVAGVPGGSDATCNNQDDDCDGTKDEDYVSVATSCGLGACAAAGTSSCVAGAVVSSCIAGTPAATDATCNNIDDNCNGTKDEGYVVNATSCGVGACSASGFNTCSGGVVSNSCIAGTPAATDTTCNNVDDNCNGTKDEGYVVTATSCGVGACAATGSNTCVLGAVVNTCTAGTAAATDTTCNNIDDNCNGAKDEGYVVTSTSCGVGACARTGQNTCVTGAVVNSCMAGTAAATDTSCNNIDDNCNGSTDEGFVSVATSCGVGACLSSGVTSCVSGSTLNSCTPGTAAANDATCNNIDDDCSGARDEDFVGQPTTCGVGACLRSGVTTCSTGGVNGNTCVAGTMTTESCNNIDDDCNGVTDNVVSTSCGTGQAGVCAAGMTSCNAGASTCVSITAASAEICDALDNDCVLGVNNGNPGGGGACLVSGQFGPCAVSTFTCGASNTSLQCLQVVNPTTEICVAGGGVGPGDGIDNNCDGTVDINPSVTDNIGTTCGTGGLRTVNVGLGGTGDVSGNVTISGAGSADYFLVNFSSGTVNNGTTYHPKFTFTQGGGTYTMTAFTTTACSTPVYCGGGNYTTIEASYGLVAAIPGYLSTCQANNTCTDQQARQTQYVIRVQRAVPTTVNCNYYTVHISN